MKTGKETETTNRSGGFRDTLMTRIASFIVNKRNAFVVLFILACIYSILSVSKVEVISELTDYLPDTTETRQGLDIMEEEFQTFGTAKVLVTNITYEKALEETEALADIWGISSVDFYDWEEEDDIDDKEKEIGDYYKDASALYTLTFDEEEDTELSQRAIAAVRERLSGYQAYFYTTIDKDDDAQLREDMKGILAVAAVIILIVLFFTSGTYMEIVIFLITFLAAILINSGTNYLFGSISFVTNAVAAVLQLALSIDYAIIFFHRFMEEHETKETLEAVTAALAKAIPEISSSSLTTVSGMVALMFMQFGIGMDLGRVLTKAIVISLLTVFLLMPALIVMFSRSIEKTAHRSFVPRITLWGKMIVRMRYPGLILFIGVMVGGCILSGRCEYVYDHDSIQAARMNEYLTAKSRISQSFDVAGTMAVVVPKGDYPSEAKVIEKLREVDMVDSVTGLSDIEVDDEGKYILVDSLNPREFAEVADLDLDVVRLLYRFYAFDQKQYGAFIRELDSYRIPVIDMIDFIYDQKEHGGLDLGEELSEDVDDLHRQVTDAREQLEGENYARIVFTMLGPVEGREVFERIDEVRSIAEEYYDEVYVVGNSTSDYDLSKSFQTDNIKISVLTALFVGIILLFTFQSAGLPILLVLTIQSSIWINFSIPVVRGETMFFLSYLIVSAIQMGATIDYAIVITSRYMALRETGENKRDVVIRALNEAFPTIITSGSILTCAGFVVEKLTSNAIISSLGRTLGTGTLISMILVMTVLPQLLMVFDGWIAKTAFNRGAKDIAVTVVLAALLVPALPTVSSRAAETESMFQTADDENIVITSVEELERFSRACREENFSKGKHVSLAADLDMSGALNEKPFEPIPVFCGSFDGNGYTIRGLAIRQNGSGLGFFRCVEEGAVVENLNIEGELSPQGSRKQIGGIVGVNRGTIRNCTFDGSVMAEEDIGGIAGRNEKNGRIESCVSYAELSGKLHVGGICGNNEGIIIDSSNEGVVNVSPDAISEDISITDSLTISMDMEENRSLLWKDLHVEKVYDIGGIAGVSSGMIENCSNSNLVGYESVGYNIGGIAGRSSGRIVSCENHGRITGRKDVGGITGQLEPVLAVDYGDSTLDKVSGIVDEMMDTVDSLSEKIEGTSDQSADIADRMETILEEIKYLLRSQKEIQRERRIEYDEEAGRYLDDIDDILDQFDVEFGSKSADRAEHRVRTEVSTIRELLGMLGGDELILSDDEPVENLATILQYYAEIVTQLETQTNDLLIDTDQMITDRLYGIERGAQELEDQADELLIAVRDLLSRTREYKDQLFDALDGTDDEVTAQLDLLYDEFDNLSGTLDDGKNQFRREKDEISRQADDIKDTMDTGWDQLKEERDELLDDETDLFEDVSEQMSEMSDGVILNCTNRGTVAADYQGGGIAGTLGVEASLDPDEDIRTSGERSIILSRTAQACVRGCYNEGRIRVRKDYAGGIAGAHWLGLLEDNQNTGDVLSEDGSYVGGIAGGSLGIVKGCQVMCEVSGGDHIGGIVGSGRLVKDNCSMAVIISEEGESLGSIAGGREDGCDISGNSYVDEGLGAVDGVTYTREARGASYEILREEGILPEEFGRLKVIFMADGVVVREIICDYGESLTEDQIPAVPQKKGFYEKWEDVDLSSIRKNYRVEAVYHPWVTTLASSEDSLPEMLAEGEFMPGACLTVSESDGTELRKESVPAGYRIDRMLSYKVEDPENAQTPETVILHVLAPDADAVGIMTEDGVERTEFTRDGSYLVFESPSSGSFVILKSWPVWSMIAAGGALFIIVAVLFRRKKKAKGLNIEENTDD
ncbi:MAG: MMPL family transporter [Clostridiales bacterium]|nr:MMPL family transporter [Clostridiales bacterium]